MSLIRLSLLLAVVATPALAATPLAPVDHDFVAMVSQGGMFEVRAGQLAASQGGSQDIRDSGSTEAHDHKLVGDRLVAIVTPAGMTLPDTLNPAFTSELDDLKAKAGHAFDVLYLADMQAVHAKDGAAFAAEARSGSNPALRQFAVETHRIVQRHIGELKALGAD